jgi:hypothetical protein
MKRVARLRKEKRQLEGNLKEYGLTSSEVLHQIRAFLFSAFQNSTSIFRFDLFTYSYHLRVTYCFASPGSQMPEHDPIPAGDQPLSRADGLVLVINTPKGWCSWF